MKEPEDGDLKLRLDYAGKVFGVLVTKEEWSKSQVRESYQLMRSRELAPLWVEVLTAMLPAWLCRWRNALLNTEVQ